jgi:hypothetical protein
LRQPNSPFSCQRDSRTGQFNRCENARQDKRADQARLDADRARRDRDRAKLERDRANGDWQRANRDQNKLDRDRNNIRGDKNDINRDGRRECNNLSGPRPKYVYVRAFFGGFLVQGAFGTNELTIGSWCNKYY